MLMLICDVGKERYAIPCKEIVEVISLVKLQNLSQVPKYVAGLLNYRGDIIPIIDLCELLTSNQHSYKFSTRILVVKYFNEQQTPYLLGLIAEKVTETLNIEEADLKYLEIPGEKPFYSGEIITAQHGIILCIQVKSLLSESQLKALLTNSSK